MTQQTKLIQQDLFMPKENELSEMIPGQAGRARLALLYKVRYVHPKTKVVLKNSHFLKNGKKKHGCQEFLYNSEWITPDNIPEERERIRDKNSSLRSFLLMFKADIGKRTKAWKKQGRNILGVNEFKDKLGCCDKLLAQLNEQVKKYGYKCPITHIDFTTIRNNKKEGKGRIISNISSDRLFIHINYTKQNLLFTSVGWNLARQNFSLEDIKRLFPGEFVKRYEEILAERFPDNGDYA